MQNEKSLTLGSLFDGSGGFPFGGLLCGITPVWASEIEPFPIRVTTRRLPFMKHYGDVSGLKGSELEPVDIITFGSPCQDMSVAGKRSGLDGNRSSLFYEAIRIVKEMRCATNGRYPRYIVWENVPGAFSSNKGEDFKAVLEAVCSVKDGKADIPRYEKWPGAGEIVADHYSIAWRVLDAQYWGVPQRRKRIFLVADFAGTSAGQILFESEGLSGYSAEGFRSWQRTAGSAAACAGAAGGICLNDHGGSCMDISNEVTGTLRAEMHGHPPCVMDAAGFCTEHSAHSRSIGYEEERSPTLREGVVPAAVYENHSQDTRYTGPLDIAPTVSSTYGTGGNNQPFVVKDEDTPKTLKIRSGCEGGGKGALIQEDKSATLSCNNDQTLFVPFCKGTRPHSKEEAPNWKNGKVANTLNTFDAGERRCNELIVQAYGISSDKSNAMLSDNPHSGIYEAETSRTLDTGGGNPGCNQGGIAVVESYSIQGSMIGREDKNGPQGDGVNEDVSFTLNTVDRHAVYAMTTGSYTQVKEETAPTLMARDFKDPATVNCGYTVRRLTPTECARLQGFPDWWCAGLGTKNPTDEDLTFWRDVFETHRKVMGMSSKAKTDKQIIKWLKDPYTDAAEYKMWGNGVALPCVAFVLAGIVYYAQLSAQYFVSDSTSN